MTESMRERIVDALVMSPLSDAAGTTLAPVYRAADAVLAVVADVDGIAGVLAAHAARPAGSPHCVCGWRPAIYLNDTESDRQQHLYHQAEAVAAYLRGES